MSEESLLEIEQQRRAEEAMNLHVSALSFCVAAGLNEDYSCGEEPQTRFAFVKPSTAVLAKYGRILHRDREIENAIADCPVPTRQLGSWITPQCNRRSRKDIRQFTVLCLCTGNNI